MPLLTCPNDGGGMQEINRNGVWLDRGELEKLLSYIREDEPDDYRLDDRGDDYKRDEYRRERYGDDRYEDGHKYKGKKKRSLFDFFD
jgi:uncharacterized protein